MTKEEILAAAGYPNTPDGIAAFYNEYDTPDAFFAKHGGSLNHYKPGGEKPWGEMTAKERAAYLDKKEVLNKKNKKADAWAKKAETKSREQAKKEYYKEWVAENYDKGAMNPMFQTAASFTPFGTIPFAMQSAVSAINNLAQGNYLDAGIDAAFANPLFKGLKGSKQVVPKVKPKLGQMEGLGTSQDVVIPSGKRYGPIATPVFEGKFPQQSFTGNIKGDLFDLRNTGYTDVPSFNKQLNQMMIKAQFGKRPLETKIGPTNVQKSLIKPENIEYIGNDMPNVMYGHYLDTDLMPGKTKPYTAIQALQSLNPNKYGGPSGAPHNGQPTADQFFNYGSHVNDKLNIPMSNPFYLEEGGAYYGGPTRPYAYGGDITEFCWGGGLPGGPNEMPEMLHGGYHSPMNYGSFPAVEWGGALDASNEDEFPMMDDGGSNLAKIIKAASKKMKKTYTAGGKTTIQGGNQNYLENKRASFDDAIKNNIYNAFIKEEEKVAMQALNPYATGMEDMDQTYQAKKGKQKEPDDVPVDFAKTLPDLFPTGRDYSKYLPADIQSQYMMSNADYAKMADLNQRLKDKTFNLTNFEGTPEWGAMARLLGKTGRKMFGPKSVTYKFTGKGIKQVPVKDTELNLPGFEKQRQQGATPSQLMNDYYNQGSTEFEDTAGTGSRNMIEPENMQMRKGQMPDGLKESSYMRSLMLKKNPLMQEYLQDYDNNEFQDKASDQNIQFDPYLINNAQNVYENYMRSKQGFGQKKYGGILGKYQMAGQVTPEQYYELEKMYKAAQAANVANPGKMNEATGAFQQRYHELYPERAQEIIQSRGQATTKGKGLAPGQQFSLESNVDKYFGPTTEKYWQSIEQPQGAMAQPGSVTGTYPQLQDMNVPDTGMNLNFKSPASTPNLAASTKPSTLGTGANLQGPNEPDTNIGNLNLASAQGVKPTKDEILAKKAGMDMKPLQKGKPELTGPTDTEVGPEETIESKVKRKTKGIGKAIAQYAPGAANWLASNLEKKPKLDPMQNQPIVLGNRGDYRDAEGMGEFRPDQQVPVQFPGGYGAYRTKFGGALPQALSGLEIKMQPGLYGTNGNRQFSLPTQVDSQRFSQQPTEVRNSLTAVPRDQANLEAEGGETALVNIDGIPAHFKISGKRHSQGGVPLDLPDNSFIYSDTASMKIKDPNILAQFGMAPKKGGYTPAEIAKKYDINKYRKILSNPNSEDLERKTAEAMIANNNMKLAKLAMAQESLKGFPQGIPVVAMPYMIANDIDPAMYAPTQAQEEQPDADMGVQRYGGNIISQFPTMRYGGLTEYQKAGQTTDDLYGFSQTNKNIDKMLEVQTLQKQKEGKEKYYKNYNKAMYTAEKQHEFLKNQVDKNLKTIADKYKEAIEQIRRDNTYNGRVRLDETALEKIKGLQENINKTVETYKTFKNKLSDPTAVINKEDIPYDFVYKPMAGPNSSVIGYEDIIKNQRVLQSRHERQNPKDFKNNPQLQNQIMQGMGVVDPYTFKPVKNKYHMMPSPIPGGERMFAEEIPVEEDVVVEQTTKPATKNVEVKKKPAAKANTKTESKFNWVD